MVENGYPQLQHVEKEHYRQLMLPAQEPSPVYAIDCEMVRTDNGLELARLSVLSAQGKILYDALIKPARSVRDHLTKYVSVVLSCP